MKVHMIPNFTNPDKGEGGIRRVVEAQERHLPDHGIEFVDKAASADVVNCHATAFIDHPNVVHSLHGLYWHGYQWQNWAHKANQRLIEIMYNPSVQVITSPSEWVANSVRRGTLIDPKVVYHGVELAEWEPSTSREDYVIWGKTRVDAICDPTPLNKLAEKATGTRFITTYGDERLSNVFVMGKRSFPEFKELLRNARIYMANVMETGGITVMEAMACGVVPLGFRWGANPEIIDHLETGYLVEPGDVDGMLRGLEYLRDKKNWRRMSEAAREAIRARFQWKDVIHGYVEAYEAALQEHTGPTVSVIVTAYNLDTYLPACIDSVRSQDFKDWELIVVDDHSPDHCGELADAYAREDRRIKVLHNPTNVYLAEARNIGIRHSRGKYIIPLDADDRLGKGALGILSRALDQNPNLDIVTGAMEYNEGDEWKISGWPPEKPSYNYQIRGHNMVPYASMYRRWVWERTGGYRRRCRSAEDAEFWTRAMSFGARPGKVTNKPTLIYLNRPESMSHVEPTPDWKQWFIWHKIDSLTPYGASGTPPDRMTWPVKVYGPPKLSVVIPCGKGHDRLLQDSLDSLVGQTFTDWEVVVVNDTGERWFNDRGEIVNHYIRGYPFARFIDGDKTVGVSAARNKGIAATTTPFFVLLDADDYMQPPMLEVLYQAIQELGGWVYSDFYDQEGTAKEVRDFNAEQFLRKMCGPSTGIYRRADWEKVGGFDEKAPGWEDWSFQLSLFEIGSCGSRIPMPLFTYRYVTGTRRERDFSSAPQLVQYIQVKHYKLYEHKDFFMGCKKCPGGGGAIDVALRSKTLEERNAILQSSKEMVEVRYVGLPEQRRRLSSKVDPRIKYTYGGNDRRLFVYKADAEWMEMMKDFEIVPPAAVETATVSVDELPVIVAERIPVEVPRALPLSLLDISIETRSILEKTGFSTVGEVPKSIADLVSIKGIGPARAQQILDAVDALS